MCPEIALIQGAYVFGSLPICRRRNIVLTQMLLGLEPSGAKLYEGRLRINFTEGKAL